MRFYWRVVWRASERVASCGGSDCSRVIFSWCCPCCVSVGIFVVRFAMGWDHLFGRFSGVPAAPGCRTLTIG